METCPAGVFHLKLVFALQMLIGVSQLIVALVGTVIVTQVRPWKKFKVSFFTSNHAAKLYGRIVYFRGDILWYILDGDAAENGRNFIDALWIS